MTEDRQAAQATRNLFETVQPVRYADGKVWFLDQTLLPARTEWAPIETAEACRDAIARLVVRGAPAIGIAAAFGLAVAARGICASAANGAGASKAGGFLERLEAARALLASARPTAVNLFWALDRMMRVARARAAEPPESIVAALFSEAEAILREDALVCRRIGEHGQAIMRDGMGVLTHCNAGALATSQYGTALAPIYVAKERGLSVRVYADETRPLLQGARLTAYELLESGVDVTLIADGMAATVMAQGLGAGVHRRLRPRGAQRGHGEQDRHARRRHPGAPLRHPVLRGLPVLHGRPRARGRWRHTHRGARRGRAAVHTGRPDRAVRGEGVQSRLRRDPGRARRRFHNRGGRHKPAI